MPSSEPPIALAATDRARRVDELLRLLDSAAALSRQLVAAEEELPGPGLREPERLAAALDLSLGEAGLDADAVLQRVGAVLRATPSTAGWRSLNQLFGGREPVATVAEMLAALPNASMYTFKAAGPQILVEREVLRRMASKVGFEAGEGCFTPGGSLANLVAMLLARNQAQPEGRERGVAGAGLTVYTSAEGHYSIPKNAGILGLGRDNVRRIAVDPGGHMDVGELARRIAADRERGLRPVLVNATAGTTVRGTFDRLRAIAAVTRPLGVWLHVDACYGGSLALSREHRHLLDGVELADSCAWDPHKMMGVTLQSSALLVARRGLLAHSLDESADYLFQADDEDLNPGRRSLQCGRRNDALKLWALWLHLGDRGWSERLGRQMAIARRAAERIDGDPELALCEWPESVNVCFEVRGRSSAALCELLDHRGRLKIGHGVVRGRRAIRLVCVNPSLDDDALSAILAEIKQAARQLPAGDNEVAPAE